MSKEREALKLALEALQDNVIGKSGRMPKTHEAINAIREVLAQKEQEFTEHPPHRHCECVDCVEYFKPEQEPVALRETRSKIIKALAGIVTVPTPDKLFDLDAIPREPVMHLVQQIKTAIYEYKQPQRTWVGLTDEEKQEWIDAMPYDPQPRHCMILVNVIEAKLKEKNT